MAARNLKRNISHFTPAPVVIFAQGVGAATDALTALQSAGAVTLIDQTGTGLYTATLADKYNSLLWFAGSVEDTTTPDDWEIVLVSETVATTKLLNFAVFKGGALTDLTTDDKLRLHIVVSNSARNN